MVVHRRDGVVVDRELEVLVDSTQDAFGARVWTRTICRGSVEDQELGFMPEGCDEAVVIR
jgi:hypothetical protein